MFLKIFSNSQENTCVGDSKTPTQVFSCEVSKIFTGIYFQEHLRSTASICNIIRKSKSGVSHLNQIWIKCEEDRLEKDRFQLTLNKTFCPTPPPLIQRRFKHRQRTKINKNNAFCLPLIGFPHKAHNISIENQVNIPS